MEEELMIDQKSMMIEIDKTNEESWKRILIEMNAGNKENTEKLYGVLIKNKELSKDIKPAKGLHGLKR